MYIKLKRCHLTLIRLMLQIEEANTDAELRAGWVLDNFPMNFSQMDALQQGEILPDILFCLRDSGGNQGGRHINKTHKQVVVLFKYIDFFQCSCIISLHFVEQF